MRGRSAGKEQRSGAAARMRSRTVSMALLRPAERVDSSTSDSRPSGTQITGRRAVLIVFYRVFSDRVVRATCFF